MEPLMIKNREDSCPVCGNKRCVELYDNDNRPVRFTFLLDSHQVKRILERKLSHFKCKICHANFSIDWKNPDIPKPLTQLKIDDFMRNYSNIIK